MFESWMKRGGQVQRFQKPEYHFVRNTGGLYGKDFTELSDDSLAEYLRQDSMLKEKKRYRISPEFILREIAGEYAIVPLGAEGVFTNTMMAPNDTAAFLWKAFEQPRTIDDVVRIGMQRYEVTEDVIRKSTENFIGELMEYKILEEED